MCLKVFSIANRKGKVLFIHTFAFIRLSIDFYFCVWTLMVLVHTLCYRFISVTLTQKRRHRHILLWYLTLTCFKPFWTACSMWVQFFFFHSLTANLRDDQMVFVDPYQTKNSNNLRVLFCLFTYLKTFFVIIILSCRSGTGQYWSMFWVVYRRSYKIRALFYQLIPR